MDFWNWIYGLIRIQITSADTAYSLSVISLAGYSVYDSEIIDELNASITIRRTDYRKVEAILTSRGDKVELLREIGLFWHLKQLVKRPVLTVGILTLLILNIFLPGRILFVQVIGNTITPTRQIIEYADVNGLGFGALRREIRSERIKNALLEAIPQLQWCGVNTRGCVAVISVKERRVIQQNQPSNVVSSIVASRDGVVYECTVTRGNPVCKIGQAVKTGEVLISGYTDCGLTIQATKAEGEVYAKTERAVSLLLPRMWQIKMDNGEKNIKYSLIIGKKRINLYNGSGISYPSCGKMYKEYFLKLPGNFVLPIRVMKEIWINFDALETQFDAETASKILSDYSRDYMTKHMVAGQILTSDEFFAAEGAIYQMDGKYACLEMIGQVREEGIYGDND